jgi:hypothetical protein
MFLVVLSSGQQQKAEGQGPRRLRQRAEGQEGREQQKAKGSKRQKAEG